MPLYVLGLLGALFCLGLTDYRYKLALFHDAKLSIKVLASALLFFIVWDLIGIAGDIFFTGSTKYLIGVFIIPDLPIEEVFFLLLLCYTSLLLWRGTDHG